MIRERPAPDVPRAYAERAAEYAALLGTMSAVHPADEHLVRTWATGLDGPVLDVGCGPGHWTAHLAAAGVDVDGIDPVPAFVALARERFPGTRFDVGSSDRLPRGDGTLGGVLAWYSTIHHEPAALPAHLAEIARVLRPGGGLVLGFFVGSTVEPFEHQVVTAWRWTPDALTALVAAAGFTVDEVHTRIGAPDGPRPHGALLARRRP